MPELAVRRTRARNAVRTIARTPSRRAPATAEARALLLRSGWSPSSRPGRCVRCRTPFYPPQAIRYEPTESPRAEYRADCCPGEDRG